MAINRFKDDTPEEIAELIGYARSLGVEAVLADPWMGGGGGCVDLADAVHRASCEPSDFRSI
ncbi:formate--tetrahydrofolate ligase, partial [Klebsiella pneumoniae]